MVKVVDDRGHVHWVSQTALQPAPIGDPPSGSDMDRAISLLAVKAAAKKKKAGYNKPAYPAKKKKVPPKKKKATKKK